MNSILKRRYLRQKRGIELNLAPFMDMVFILLIFFLVTSTFSKESGLDIKRPEAKSAVTVGKTNLTIGIDKRGLIFVEGKQIDIRLLESRLVKYARENPDFSVLILCDKSAKTGMLIKVLDICKISGVKNISVAARKTGGMQK